MAFNSAPLALLSDHQMNPNNSNIEYLNLTNTDQNNLTNPHQNLHNRYYQPPQDTDMNHQSYNLSQEHRQLQPWDGNGYPEHYDMNNSGYIQIRPINILKIFKPTQPFEDLNAATKQRLENIGLTRLRKEANENVTHHRMTDNIREELDELYYQFQCSINRLLANTGVGAHLLYEHLGWKQKNAPQLATTTTVNTIRLLTNSRVYPQDKPDEVTRLWHSKSKAEQDRYRDMDYIESIVDNSIKESKAESKGIVQSSVAGQKYTRSVLADWVRKISIDLKSLSFFHQIEGKQSKEAQKKTSVGYKNEVVPVHEWDEGNHKPNLKSICRRLSALMYNASGGEIDKGWPATDTASMLQKYNLKPPPTTVATKNNTPAPKKQKRHHRTDNTASEEATVTGTAPADTTTATTGNSADSASTLTESGQTSGAQTSHANVTPTGSSAGATGSPPPTSTTAPLGSSLSLLLI
ncbi:hypothetical protein H4Q26_011734 [Puccinia striiformis f. sp. tritici PST-130]|nr:hypothetical protein H4Q26_011734 [Puccinia striiformis f. sp. tritici PST-130]